MIPGEVESVACKGITDDSSILSWTVNIELLLSEHLDTMSPVIRTNVRSDEINIYILQLICAGLETVTVPFEDGCVRLKNK